MKLSCEIVRDLLPLYEDGLCSEVSCKSIEEHLEECQSCHELLENMRDFKEPELPESMACKEDEVVAKSFRKVRRRWKTSLVAMLLVFPILLLSINQVRGEGMCFTNMDDIWVVGRYVHALELGDFEKAASYMDYAYSYRYLQRDMRMTIEDFEKDFRKVTLNGEEWMITEEYYREYCQYEEDAQEIWSNLIFNMIPQVMIPVDVWEEILSLQPEAFQKHQEGTKLVYEKDGVTYTRIANEWGIFVVEQNSGLLQCESAMDFYSSLSLLPMNIYEDAKDEALKQAWKAYDYMQEHYQEVADMSLGEFTEFMQEYYTNQLQECADLGHSFKNKGFASDYTYYTDGNGHWHIGYEMEITYGGEVYPVYICFSVENWKIINIVSMHWPEKYFEETEDKTEALILSYPD